MVFAKQLREGVRRGFITCSIRIWKNPRVKVGNRYRMEDGWIEIESIEEISLGDITQDLAQESGFASRTDLLETARHGSGENVYLVRFRFLLSGRWNQPKPGHPLRLGALARNGAEFQ
jgi:hypothetical protein